MVFNFYPHLPNNWEDYDSMCDPIRQSIRLSHRTKDPKHRDGYYDHFNREAYASVNRILEDSVGKKFDNIYSEVCHRFSKKKNFKFRQEFSSSIDKRKLPESIYSGNDYYLDDNRVIRKYNKQKVIKPDNIIINSTRVSDTYYRINKELLLRYPKILDRIRQRLGNSVIFDIFNLDKLSSKEGRSILYEIQESLREDYGFNVCGGRRVNIDDFICEKYDALVEECKPGSRRCSRYFAELRDASRKRARERKASKEKELLELLYKIERKRRSEALLYNIIIRDKSGFDENSFYGEAYHGQKRKKRKQLATTGEAEGSVSSQS